MTRPQVESIMAPCRTVMDLVSDCACRQAFLVVLKFQQSLALALYFASRGEGQIRATPGSQPVPYASTARVLLNGLGSDELLGGYGRHRSVYHNGGWPAVISEVKKLRCIAR